MHLPDDRASPFWLELRQDVEARTMPSITSVEWIGRQEGKQAIPSKVVGQVWCNSHCWELYRWCGLSPPSGHLLLSESHELALERSYTEGDIIAWS